MLDIIRRLTKFTNI